MAQYKNASGNIVTPANAQEEANFKALGFQVVGASSANANQPSTTPAPVTPSTGALINGYPTSSNDYDKWIAQGRKFINGKWYEGTADPYSATNQANKPIAQQDADTLSVLLGGETPTPIPKDTSTALDLGDTSTNGLNIGTSKEARDEQIKKDVQSEYGTTGDITAAIPGLPNYQSTFDVLRAENGMEAIETQLTNIDKTIADTQASLTSGLYDEEGKLKPMELIGSAQRELARQGQELLDTLNRSKSTLVAQYNTKANLINNTMEMMQMDYAAAVADYNAKFNQHVKIQEIINNRIDRADKEANQMQDDARSNLGVITETMSAQNKLWKDLTPSMQAQITKLEMEAGIPQGSTKLMYESADATKDIKFHTYSTDKTQLSVTYSDGTTQVFSTGLTAKGENESDVKDTAIKAFNDMEDEILHGTDVGGGPIRGKDGKISPKNYIKAKKALFDGYGISGTEFDKKFLKYANFDYIDEYKVDVEYPEDYK